MNLIKSVFVSLFLAASVLGTLASLVGLIGAGIASPWLGATLACAAPAAFFLGLFARPAARTSRHLYPVLGGGAAGALLSWVQAGAELQAPVLLAFAVGVAGSALYVFWYSRFAPPASFALGVGKLLPDFELVEEGRRLRSAQLTARPALWIFYRGNWCPLCMAQIREVSGQYRELARRGVEVYLVSPQPQSNTTALANRFDVPMRFFRDEDNAAAARLGILERSGLPAGMQVLGYDSDVPRPTVFITEAGGRLIYCDLTDNYRVRPEPATLFAVLDRHAIG